MADLPAPPNGQQTAASNREATAGAASKQSALRRDILPIPDVEHVGLTTYDAKDPDTTYPPIVPLRPPEGAPNVLIVLLDDVGFGASSAFGGPCSTPTAERLAGGGLKLNRFHTTALCSPTRQAMLTGRNHHSVGMGGITEIATSAPGYNSIRPKNKAPVAETLVLNGYSTAQFGKCHEVPVWEVSPVGPFHQWPTGSGFEYFYGFIGGEANQYYPGLYEGTAPVEPGKTPEEGYTETLAARRPFGHKRPESGVARVGAATSRRPPTTAAVACSQSMCSSRSRGSKKIPCSRFRRRSRCSSS
jgi:Sulfatase